MDFQFSKFPDNIVVDEDVELITKSMDHYEEFLVLASINQDYLTKWLPWAKNIPNDQSEEHYRKAQQEKIDDIGADWSIFYKGKLCGAIGLMKRGLSKEDLEIGYWIGQEYNGKGIVTKSVKALVDLSLSLTDAPYVEIGCDVNNKPSANVAKRAGFEFVKNVYGATHVEHVDTASIYRYSRLVK